MQKLPALQVAGVAGVLVGLFAACNSKTPAEQSQTIAGQTAVPIAGQSAGGAGSTATTAGSQSTQQAAGAAGTARANAGGAGASGAGAAGRGGAGATSEPTAPAAGSGGASAVAGTGGAAGGGGAAGAAQPPAEACNPADKTPEATTVNYMQEGKPPTGPFPVVVETEPGLTPFTIYRPKDLAQRPTYPLIVFENGGCVRDGLMFAEFISEITSYGFVSIVSGAPNGSGMGTLGVDGKALLQAMDWATKETARPCSKYYRKLEDKNVAAMGQSCGGLHAYGASKDPRVATVGIWNSGLLQRNAQTQAVLDGLHSSIGYFIGGMGDVAYPNADADFKAIKQNIPIFYGNLDVGHLATYSQDNGGEFARVGTAWLRWQLHKEESAETKGMFAGADCGLCKTEWVILKKNME